ncbi:MAG: 7-carboxy-7-deazaguanine synthase QueE [Fimbriimonadaceae bacterium]
MSKLRIAEIFSSIQGEGIWAGTPSTFVRISGCNLRCIWCDTPYASWKPEGPSMSLEEIVDQVTCHSIEHVVLTGGEPMLFDPVEHLAARLKARGHMLTIETAGTIHRELDCDLMSISPKLANSSPGGSAGPGWKERHETIRLNPQVLRELTFRYPYQLKFVVNPDLGIDGQVGEIESLISSIGEGQPNRILLMAEGTDSETLHRRERMLVETCMKKGWLLTPRLHIDLFGNTRGT